MRKKVICISYDYWPDSYEKWGFSIFERNGYKVEPWRIGTFCANLKIMENMPFEVKDINSWVEYYISITKNIRNAIFLFWAYDESLYKSMALIHSLGGKYCIIDWSSMNNNKNTMLHEKLIRRTQTHWMDKFLPDYSFLGSRHHTITINSVYQLEKGNNVYLHSYDYDVYMKDKKRQEKIEVDEPYILFIDQNLLDHKDQINGNFKKWIPNEDVYIKEMNNFLNELEKQFELPIIVAAHPVKCKRRQEIYGERKIVNDTCKYVSSAELVVSFCSGAIGFAVAYKKPMIIFNSYQMRRSLFYSAYQMPKARLLNARIVDISQELDKIKLQDYLTNPANYNLYMEYMTASENEKVSFMESVMHYIKKL